MATKQEALTAFDFLASGFPSFQYGPEFVAAFVQDTEDLDAACLFEACKRLRRASKFFPSIAEIRDTAEAIRIERTPRLTPPRYIDSTECKPKLTEEQRKRNAEMVDRLAGMCRMPWDPRRS